MSVDSIPVYSNRTYLFDNVIQIKWEDKRHPFSLPGDSGSMVYVKEKGKLFALGMIFAANRLETLTNKSEPFSYACTFKDVLLHNNLTFL